MPEKESEVLPERIPLDLTALSLKVEPAQVLAWVKEKQLTPIDATAEPLVFAREEIFRFMAQLDVERNAELKPFPVVGIGSSAGGLKAVTELLDWLDTDLGMAYVFISHLSPDQESLLPELMQKHTAMPVLRVENGLLVKPDHIYVITPNTSIGIVDGALSMQKPRLVSQKGFHPINEFLMALAEAYQMNAIGVVLSGTASDGSLGVNAIKAGGGWTFAQDDSADFKEMPQHAQATGAVDFVLSPRKIAQRLKVLREHPVGKLATASVEEYQSPEFQEILGLILSRTGVDFSQYKRATISRRILRRLVLNKMHDLQSYIQLLLEDEREAHLLFEDLLINVTSFFREPRFFEALKQHVLPRFARAEGDGTLRIWVAGCSSGEEAVSIGITVMEYFRTAERVPPVQIFATDVDPGMVEKARKGIYGTAAMESVSPAMRSRYFIKVEAGYQVVKPIRDMCVFAEHDLMKDPPFSRIDLVSCQNVMIYFKNSGQRKVLHNFHYALLPDGYLALGRSESVNAAGDLFAPVSKEDKLFTKRDVNGVVHFTAMERRKQALSSGTDDGKKAKHHGGLISGSDLDQEAERLLLHRHVPASLVVNRDLDIVRFRGATAPYLAPQSGKASLSLLKMVREDLVFELRGLLNKVKEERTPISRSGLEIEVDGVFRTVSIEVAPMRTDNAEEHYLIVFLDDRLRGTSTVPLFKEQPQEEQDAKARRIALLEREVRDVRDQMRILLEDAEGRTDQLQTAHEELLSSNEELQSMNEELETSKEELQSTNEELTTINDELVQRQQELKQSRDYAEGIIGTISTPLVVLNSTMRVRGANAAFYEAFRTTKEETEGTLLHELGNHQWDVAGLRAQLMEVLQHGAEMRGFEVKHVPPGEDERTFHLSARRIQHLGPQQRMLVTMQDVTEQLRSTAALFHLAAIVTNSRDAILSMDLDGYVTSWNKGAELLFGWTENEMKGQDLDRLLTEEREGEVQRLIKRVKEGEHIHFFETERQHKDGHVVQVSLTVSPMRAPDGEIIGISKIERDITTTKAIAASLQESEERFHLLANNMDQLAWITNKDHTQSWFNGRWAEFSGIPTQEIAARFEEIHHPDHYDRVNKLLAASMQHAEPWECTFPLKRSDGEYRWMLSRSVPQTDNVGQVLNWFGTATDITDMMNAEEALQEADRRKDEFLATLAHELRNPMAPLRTGLEVLQDVEGDEVFIHTRKVMTRQVDHLARLVEDLLDLGRINTGSIKLHRENMDPVKAMQDAAETVAPLVKAKDQQLTIQKNGTAAFINGDMVRITQVFSNLLHNASKFTPNNGQIDVAWNVDAKHIEFRISDTGIGIAEDQREHVFDMFAQVDDEEHAKAGGGLGIGLHLVKRFVNMHEGQVWVTNNDTGPGSTFVLSLPLVVQEKTKKEHVNDSTKVEGGKVLLVDDNKDSALMLSLLLRAKKVEVEVAYSGEQGLKAGEKFTPSTVFMDIGMPGMDGYEACRRMRATPWGAKARIIALSGWGQEDDKKRSKEAGFDAHLVKPVDRTTLFEALNGGSTHE